MKSHPVWHGLITLTLPLAILILGCCACGDEAGMQRSMEFGSSGNAYAADSYQAVAEESIPSDATSGDSSAALYDTDMNWRAEEIYENPFRAVSHSPLSTFSIDVDAASYSNVRGYLDRGSTPPPSVVRIEELVNYFSYDYPEPAGEHSFAFNTEVADCPWNPSHRLVRVALQGKHVHAAELPPANLVFLIDVSGSMGDPDKLPLLKSAFQSLIDQLRPQDHVAIVAYAGMAGLVLRSTPGSDKDAIRAAIDKLESGGSTAGGAGIDLAYKMAARHFDPRGNNRVILATDGDFNVGVSSESELVRLIEKKRGEGIFLSVLGFGADNYQDGKMEGLADNGNGNYYFIDNEREGARVLAGELSGTLYTIAKDVKLQIAFNPDRVKAYRLIGYENRVLAARDFDNDAKDAGELGAGHSVTAFYEIVPVGAEVGYPIDQSKGEDYRLGDERPIAFASNDLMGARLRYKEPNATSSRLIEHLVTDERGSIGSASGEFRFAAAVAEWGLLLRGSGYRGSASYDQVLALARNSLGSDPDGYRAEFVRLVKESAAMTGDGVATR